MSFLLFLGWNLLQLLGNHLVWFEYLVVILFKLLNTAAIFIQRLYELLDFSVLVLHFGQHAGFYFLQIEILQLSLFPYLLVLLKLLLISLLELRDLFQIRSLLQLEGLELG